MFVWLWLVRNNCPAQCLRRVDEDGIPDLFYPSPRAPEENVIARAGADQMTRRVSDVSVCCHAVLMARSLFPSLENQ